MDWQHWSRSSSTGGVVDNSVDLLASSSSPHPREACESSMEMDIDQFQHQPVSPRAAEELDISCAGVPHSAPVLGSTPSTPLLGPTPLTRQCTECGILKPREDWHKKQWKKSGRCMACVLAQETAESLDRAKRAAEVLEARQRQLHQRQLEREAKANTAKGENTRKAENKTALASEPLQTPGACAEHPVSTDTSTCSGFVHGRHVSSGVKRGRGEDLVPGTFIRPPALNAADVAYSASDDSTHQSLQDTDNSMDVGDAAQDESDSRPASKRGKPDVFVFSAVHSSPMVAARANYRILHHENLKGTGSGTSSLPIAPAPKMNGTYHLGLGLAHTRRRRISSDSTNPSRKAVTAGPASSFPAAPQGVVPADLHRKPLVVIDGSSVAFALRQVVSNPQWSPHGILLALQFFEHRGVDAVAFVPRPRVDKMSSRNEHHAAFMDALSRGTISMVPSKRDDDLFILSYAIERSAHVVTNDLFRDHQHNTSTLASLGLTADELKNFLSLHHVSYTFARDEFVPDPAAPIIKMLTREASDRRRHKQNSELIGGPDRLLGDSTNPAV